MAGGKFVVGVVMKYYETSGGGGATDEEINDRQGTHRPCACELALRRINPPPHGFRNRHIRINVIKRLIHLIELACVAGRSTELGALGFARSDSTTQESGFPRRSEFRVSLESPHCRGIYEEGDQLPTALSSARDVSQPS